MRMAPPTRLDAPELVAEFLAEPGRDALARPDEDGSAASARSVIGPEAGELDGQTRAFYLHSEPDDVFVQLHVPPRSDRTAVGIVLVPPFGWHELCTSRVRRAWGQALAAEGRYAARLDLPGTGDSAGSPRDSARLDAWTSAVTDTARWMREALGCQRVVALGLGLGGAIAWRSASLGAPIDDLVLWAAPPRGRRHLRELAAAAALKLDARLADAQLHGGASYLEPPPALDVSGDDETLLDEGGQVLSAQTRAEIGALDLSKLPLPAADAHRILFLERPASKGDSELRSILEASGAHLSVADGAGYDDMLDQVQTAPMPVVAIDRSLAWLRETETAAPARPARPAPAAVRREGAGAAAGTDSETEPVRELATLELATLELALPGGRIRERPVELRVSEGLVRGILCEPAGDPRVDLCALLLNGGSDRRIGPNRMWVETARRWAARGVSSLRIDPIGIGESDGEERGEGQAAHYHPVNHPRSIELLDAVRGLDVPQRLVLVGFCSGAYRSLHLALADERVVGLFAISLPFFFQSRWTMAKRDMWLVDLDAHSDDSPAKAKLRRLLHRSHLLTLAYTLTGAVLRSVRDRTDRAIATLTNRQVEVLLLFKAGAKEHVDLVAHGRLGRLRRTRGITIGNLPSNDVRLRPLPVQRLINRELDDALERLLAR